MSDKFTAQLEEMEQQERFNKAEGIQVSAEFQLRLDALREIGRLQSELTTTEAVALDDHQRRLILERELESAREDKQRLDWLEQFTDISVAGHKDMRVLAWWTRDIKIPEECEGNNLREAIDKARKEQG